MFETYDVLTCYRSMSKRHKFQTLVPKLVHFTTILLILGNMNIIFSIQFSNIKIVGSNSDLNLYLKQ